MSKAFYVICPGLVKTGGTELLHQLVAELNAQGYDAVIAYSLSSLGRGCNNSFEKYVDHWIRDDEIPDEQSAVVVIPETKPEYVARFRYATTAIWWMSVDNYRLLFDKRLALELYGPLRTAKRALTTKRRDYRPYVAAADYHLYQSAYARDYLSSLGIRIEKVLRLSDYLNEIYLEKAARFEGNAARARKVLYNPSKGYRYTRRVIRASNELEWVPLHGYTNEELLKLMGTSRLYVDFGNHPGKDRLPRECAASGTCVIVGNKGSARYSEDVPVPEWARIDMEKTSVRQVANLIRVTLDEYDERVREYAAYRKFICQERALFEADVAVFADKVSFSQRRFGLDEHGH